MVTEDFVNEHTAALGAGSVGRDEYAARVPAFLVSMPGLRYEVEAISCPTRFFVTPHSISLTCSPRDTP